MNQKSRQPKPSRFVHAAVIALLLPQAGIAAWTDVGPAGTAVRDFSLSPSNPSTIILSASNALAPNGGVWRSTDSGAGWTQVISNISYYGSAVKANTSTVVLAAVEGGAVQRSATSGDNGTWGATTGSASHTSWKFAFSPSTTNVVYAAGLSGVGSNGVLQRSTDSGANWTSITIGGDATPGAFSVAVDPKKSNIVYAGVNLTPGGVPDGLYKSTNGGTSWTHLSKLTLTQIDGLAIDPNNRSIIYAGTAGVGQVRRSTDGGDTWSTVHNPISGVGNFNAVRAIAVNPDDSRVIYAAGGTGASKVIVSTDCGKTWSDVAPAGMGANTISKLEIDTVNDRVYAADGVANAQLFYEALINAGTGSCPKGNSNSNDDDSDGDGSGGGGGGGGGGSSNGLFLLLAMGLLLSFRRFRIKQQNIR